MAVDAGDEKGVVLGQRHEPRDLALVLHRRVAPELAQHVLPANARGAVVQPRGRGKAENES